MSYRLRSVVTFVLLVIGARSANAQAPKVAISDLLPNERLRLSSTTVGVERSENVRVVRAGGDTLWVALRRDGDAIPLLVREVRSVKVARGKRNSWPGAVLAGIGGAVAGLAVGALSCSAIPCEGGGEGMDAYIRVLVGFGGGAYAGAKLGYGPHDAWLPVELPAQNR